MLKLCQRRNGIYRGGKYEYRKARIGVDKGNPQSNSFWKKNGFYIISEKEYIVMEMTL